MVKNTVLAPINRGSSFDPRPFFSKSGDRTSSTKYRKDQTIFSQGDVADAVFFIGRGLVKVTIYSRRGKKAVIALLRTGDFFGEECLTGQPSRLATVAALTNSSIYRFEKSAVIDVLTNEPKFSKLFISYLSNRKIQIEEDLADQLLNSSEKRLARRLLLLADTGQEAGLTGAAISQDTLAAMIGTTQSRVSFFMNKFRRLGFVDYNGVLKVHEPLVRYVLND